MIATRTKNLITLGADFVDCATRPGVIGGWFEAGGRRLDWTATASIERDDAHRALYALAARDGLTVTTLQDTINP